MQPSPEHADGLSDSIYPTRTPTGFPRCTERYGYYFSLAHAPRSSITASLERAASAPEASYLAQSLARPLADQHCRVTMASAGLNLSVNPIPNLVPTTVSPSRILPPLQPIQPRPMAATERPILPSSVLAGQTASASTETVISSNSSSNGDSNKAGPQRSTAGCLTCRRRKVKCDERRPTCAKCTIKGRPVSALLS